MSEKTEAPDEREAAPEQQPPDEFPRDEFPRDEFRALAPNTRAAMAGIMNIAGEEIQRLRHSNRVMGDKLEVLEIIARAMGMRAGGGVYSNDIAVELRKIAGELAVKPRPEPTPNS